MVDHAAKASPIFRPRSCWHYVLSLLPVLALLLAACSGEPELRGTDMESEDAPPFTLTDHRGDTVSLADLQGKAVALTFVFTNCPDVCPLLISRMNAAYEQVPEDDRDDIAMVAITVDPERDDPQAMGEFLESRGVTDIENWYGLTSDIETLEPIWENYYVTPGEKYPADPTVVADIEEGEHDPEEFMEEQAESTPHEHEGDVDEDHSHEEGENTAYWLAHTDVIYVLDTENRLRSLMRSDDNPEDLAHNLEILAP